MEITDPKTAATLAIRRITVKLYQPTRDGAGELHILTNLPRGAANACKLANLYRKRWTIETMFQELTETLTCEISKTYTGMMIVIPPKHWTVFRDMSVAQLARVLKEPAHYVELSKYQKHPRGPKQPRPERTYAGRSNHVSTARILAKRKTAA